MTSKADRIVEVLNEKIRLTRLYLVLSGTPLAGLFGLFVGAGGPKGLLITLFAVVALLLFAFTSLLVFRQLARQHASIVAIGEARRSKKANPDIPDEMAEEIYKESHTKSWLPLASYPWVLAVSYIFLVMFVGSQLILK